METKHLDKEIERLEDMYKRTDLSEYGEVILAEYKAIKKALNIDLVSKCFVVAEGDTFRCIFMSEDSANNMRDMYKRNRVSGDWKVVEMPLIP